MAKQPLPADFRVPIKSTWRDAIGVKLTDRRITNRTKQGWYGELAKLRLLARSADKAKRKAAKEKLKRFEGLPLKRVATRQVSKPIDIAEFV
jgi:hypothetical protein